ncbi:MAG TPA: hypothetical protein VFQ08_05130 [Gaiella sp.]|jgi:hypothetical protein|nr:hypothetical protein [Gaiella sp.]
MPPRDIDDLTAERVKRVLVVADAPRDADMSVEVATEILRVEVCWLP